MQLFLKWNQKVDLCQTGRKVSLEAVRAQAQMLLLEVVEPAEAASHYPAGKTRVVDPAWGHKGKRLSPDSVCMGSSPCKRLWGLLEAIRGSGRTKQAGPFESSLLGQALFLLACTGGATLYCHGEQVCKGLHANMPLCPAPSQWCTNKACTLFSLGLVSVCKGQRKTLFILLDIFRPRFSDPWGLTQSYSWNKTLKLKII